MRATSAALVLLFACGAAAPAEVAFTAGPRASGGDGKASIAFTVSAPTDVEVAILDAKGAVVRHLAAGVLGPNAPAPLRRDSLAQEIAWDGLDDLGKPAAGGPFKARVAIGTTPKLDGITGWDGNTFPTSIVGLTVGKEGEVYVLLSENTYGRSEVRVLDRDGKYLRTIMPYPASVPAERAASIGQLEVGGERLPIVFNGHGHNLHPLTSGMKKQTMAVSPKGFLLMASAVGTIVEHGPPRHLLALTPEGGAPEGMGFVGPKIREAVGFLGGSGEGGSPWFDHLALSPNGDWIYLTMYGESYRFKQRHAIFRLRWNDAGPPEPFLGQVEPGSDGSHFNDPQGIAFDPSGNLYVCDRGNSRVMVLSPTDQLVAKFPVESPEQIAIHPKTGDIYVVSRKQGKRVTETRLVKLSPLTVGGTSPSRVSRREDTPPTEVARIEGKTFDLIALDPTASPPRLWAALNTGWGKPMALAPVTDRGDRLELGANVNSPAGLAYPMFLAADAPRDRAYVTEFRGTLRSLDLKSGKLSPYKKGNEAAVDREGNVYLLSGYDIMLERYDPTGAPLPFPSIGSHKMALEGYKSKGPNVGLRGHLVAPNGDIYILKMGFYTVGQLDVFGPDGKLKREALLASVVHGSSGLGVDAAGNVYIGSNLKPAEGSPYPAWFVARHSVADSSVRAPEKGWVWWRQKRPVPWCYPYYNAYLYHWGSVFKFPPGAPRAGERSGEFFGGLSDHEEKENAKAGVVPPKPPEGTPHYKSGYLNLDAWVKGALWRYGGYGPVPASGLNWGDPSCTCWTARLAVDDYGRVYVPDVFRFSVEMIDTNANPIARIGRYGNADSAGPGSRAPRAGERSPEPEIPFAWPAFASVSGGKLYVSDPVNGRVVVVRFEHAAAVECPLP